MNLKNVVLKYVLQNAVFYGGKASPKAVLGKVMASEPELRKRVHEVKAEIEKVVKEVNSLSREKQKEMLQKIAPELLKREEKRQETLPELPGAHPGRVVTRFAPAPTGPLNISHLLRAAMLSYLYAKKYNGKFILRFEDTDARRIEKRFYDMIMEDLKVCGVKWDKLVIESDDMELYYKYAEELINTNKAYACTCSAENFRKFKLEKRNCPCREKGKEENMKLWQEMLKGKYREGEIVLRFKTSMHDPNPAFRDPPIMRINEAEHPLKGKKYRVWPLYNYANVIEDHVCGITHVFRGKEHEHNTEIQRRIYQAFGWEPPIVVNFGMIYLPGEKLHTRDIKRMIENGEVSGWDDPRLHTVRALLRRGFQPEAFRMYAEHCSLTKTDIILNWETFESYNRKVIDPIAKRYMVVINPVKIDISSSKVSGSKVRLKTHPEKEETREVEVGNYIYVSKEDFEKFKGKKIRLKELATGVLNKRFEEMESIPEEDRVLQKIQWVPERYVNVIIVKPEGEEEGIGEYSMESLKPGDIIQMERIGFGRVDAVDKNIVTIFFAHK